MTKKAADVFSYPISYDELIETWIFTNERLGHVLIIYEPKKHKKYFEEINLPYAKDQFYLAEVISLEFSSFDEAKMILGCLDYKKGPYVQFWSLGKLITDNIEFSPFVG